MQKYFLFYVGVDILVILHTQFYLVTTFILITGYIISAEKRYW